MVLDTSTDPVAAQINAWKESLIDLTRRNPLLSLSIKAKTKTNLRLPDVTPDEAFQILSRRRKSFQFIPDSSEGQAHLFPETRPRKQGVLYTSEANLKVLNTLRQRAVLTLQEQGVNTLFVAIGLLEWFDPKTRAVLLSPLLLLPVMLERTPGEDTLRLKRLEDDIELNPTLRYRLSQRDVMTTLPDLPDEENLLPSSYLQSVEDAVRGFKDWRVHPHCYIGRFSFLKFVMYRDLDAMAETARRHPIVSALAGDKSALQRLPAVSVPEGNRLDAATQRMEMFQALDADPSQQRAIYAARAGQSFVLQGPPGTGKTQTIANIITECIATGKRVLFVSQKMAALDAVFKRLRDKGLADLCLEAHSYKATKKEILEQLRKSLTVQTVSENRQSQLLDELAESQQLLNDVAEELHRVHEPLGLSLYEANGRVTLASSVPDLLFIFVSPENVSAENLRRLEALAEQLSGYHTLFSEAENHPWRGVLAKRFSLNLQTEVRALLLDLLSLVEKLEKQSANLERLCGVEKAIGISGTDWLLSVASIIEKTPRPPANWLTENAVDDLQRKAESSQHRYAEYSAARTRLLSSYGEAIFVLPHTDLKDRLLDRHRGLLQPVLGDTWASKAAGDGTNILRLLDSMTTNTERVRNAMSSLAPLCGLTTTDTLGFCRYLLHIANQASKDPKPTSAWFAPGIMPELMRRVEEAELQHEGVIKGRDALQARYTQQLFQLDLPRLYTAFQGEYSSIWHFFKPAYYRDRRLVHSAVKPSALMPTDISRDLAMAREVRQHEEWIHQNERDLALVFGRHYRGLETNWQALRAALRQLEALSDAFTNRQVPARLQDCLVASGPEVQALADLEEQLKRHWTALGQDFEKLKKWRESDDLPFTEKPLAQAPLEDLRNWLVCVRGSLSDHIEARETILRLQRGTTIPPRSGDKLAADITEAARVAAQEQVIQKEAETLQLLYSSFYNGITTDWVQLLMALEWTRQLQKMFVEGSIPEKLLLLVTIGDAAALADIAVARQELAVSFDEWPPLYAKLGELFPVERLQAAGRSLAQAHYSAISDWLQVRQSRLPDLERWIDFQNLRENCADQGMLSFFDTITRRVPAPEQVVPAFQKRFYRLWIDSVSDTVPLLRQFRGEQHAAFIARFASLDLHQITSAPHRVRALARSRRPETLSNFGEIGALRTQLSRKRPKAIRKLLADIPNLLFSLKPCLLMSPLSVSLFLDQEKISFDLVIFDEASQIFVQDAIGALLRGRQAIIAGDTKQLPPTSFFLNMQDDNASEEDEDEEKPIADEFESVLKAADALALERSPHFAQHPLEWHYRSQHESLIAFSRKHFYERLITFPSAALKSAVTFEPVPQGIYYGGNGNRRNNPVEARRVAELVVAHVRAHPDLSAGVITFSEAQQHAIEEELNACIRQNPDLEELLSEKGSEGFFVKNIENVQGDERDVIFLSVGYGRDPLGNLYMRFGPLNRDGGERRLNVAISRARQRCTVVSSLLPQDITSDKMGPKLLRDYLEFARSGYDSAGIFLADVPPEQGNFERAVKKALESRGHEVRQQVGFFDYRMDLAILDPVNPDRYLLGIECDGLMYRNAETARARDRLRPSLLHNALGWRLLRLWSSDWVRNPDQELARVEETIQRARQGDTLAPSIEPMSEWMRQNGSEEAPEGILDTLSSPLPFTSVETNVVSSIGIPPGVVYYERAQIALPGGSEALYDEDERRRLAFLSRLVELEGPVALETAIQRLADASALSRAGSRIRSIVEETVDEMSRRDLIEVRDKFLWAWHGDNPVPRVPREGDVPRQIEYISLEEIGELVVALLKVAFGVRREELIVETARMLGYRNTGANIRDRINEALSLMELDNRIHVQGGQVRALEL